MDKLTISQIAKLCGVSTTTISRYLNEKFDYMSDQTRKIIKEVIEKHDYRPNTVARNLKISNTKTIGIVVADMLSPFSAAIIKSCGDCLLKLGYDILITYSNNSTQKELENIESLLLNKVSGILLNACKFDSPLLAKKIKSTRTPFILLDREIKTIDSSIIAIDNYIPINSAINHLKEQGYGNIYLFVENTTDVLPRYHRKQAFLKALSSFHISNPKNYVYEVDYTHEENAKVALLDVIKKNEGSGKPPAIIATNGVVLLYTIKAIKTQNIMMPTALGLCGYDDWGWATELGWSSVVDCGITVIKPDINELGQKAAKLIVRLVENPDEINNENILVDCIFEIRRSTLLK